MLAGPVTVFAYRLPVCPSEALLSSADRALNPEPPAYKAVALTSWSYRPVEHPGIEPGDTAVSERPLQPAGSCSKRGRWRCRAPRCYPSRGFRPRCGAGRAPSRAESGGNDPQRANADPPSKRSPRPAGSLSRTTPPPGVNRQGMAEDGEIESQRLHAHPVSGRGQPT